MRKEMNKNFKVKVDRILVGYAGLVSAVSSCNVDELIRRALSCQDDVYRLKCLTKNHKISFYVY